ncbi:MAG: ankyrin repeat domain-containing protein [Spirochaetales bacterium]|nr:ankyrin repeat domain-containing protein [Spirochaetales bacterium]
MKLTVFYHKNDIDFLFQFSSVSEEYFIEYESYAIEPDWEPGTDNFFHDKVTEAENMLVVLSPQSLKGKWLPYIIGYAEGKKVNCHFYLAQDERPRWAESFNISQSINDLIEYYKYYNDKWLEKATVRIAKKTLIDQHRDITLTAFVEVVKEGDCMLAGIYLEAGYKASDRDRNGVPLICWAARNRKLPMIKLLMKAGADLNAVSDDRNGTALIDAVSEDDYECVVFLLQYGPDLEVESKNGQTAMTIASGHNNTEIVRVLFEAGADMNKKDKLGMTAITYAKLQGNQDILSLFESDEE